MFFYELHEGDNEVYSDVLVVSESEWEPQEFFELVQSIRRRIQDSYHHDTLSEAIAVELEREHGFIHVSDDRRRAQTEPSGREGRVGDTTAEPPATRVVLGHVARRRTHVDHFDAARAHGSCGTSVVYCGPAIEDEATRVFL